jgi:hypothetical protein
MARILFVLALLLLHPNNAKTNLTSILNILECTINSSDFWLVYETHFLLVEFLTILVLQTEQHKPDLNYFTEALLSEMNGYEFPVTLNIEEYFLSDPNENQTSRICDESIVDEIGSHNFEPVEYETLAKIKRLSSDSPKGYFIIVWDFSTTMFYADINTLQELDESELPIAMGFWNFIKADSDLIRSLENKSIRKSHDSVDFVAYQRNLSSCESKLYTEFLMKMKYVDHDGLPLLHIVNECLSTFLLTNIVPKGSAFLTVFDNVITKIVESGLTIKWNNDIVDSLTIEKMINLNRNRTSLKSFSIYVVQSAFYIIVLGYISSFLLFLCEVLYKNK